MKQVYILTVMAYNGTTLLNSSASSYSTMELVMQVGEKLKALNKADKDNNKVRLTYKIEPSKHYESANEVPALSDYKTLEETSQALKGVNKTEATKPKK